MFESCEVLYLQFNRIERIEGLESLASLEFLALQNNCIKRVENLRHLRALEFLDLRNNQIADLEENELPQSINMLNPKGNPCTEVQGYPSKLLKRLPDLGVLDDEWLDGDDPSASDRGAAGSGGDGILGAGNPAGLAAYY